MPHKPGEGRFRPRVSLHLATSFDAAWQHVLLPWFEKVAFRALDQRAPVAVLTPFRSHAHQLRSKLLVHGISLLGVRFFSPAQLRESLRAVGAPPVPLREHLWLLLSSAAEKCAADFRREDATDSFQIANSIAREPDELLRAIDNVAAAGANFADLAPSALGAIAGRFEDVLERCGCVLVAEADRQLLQTARVGQPQFSNLLVSGFDAAHWSLWPLLHAAVLSSEEATVILRQPRDEAAELDRVWIGTWEEEFGAAQQLPPSDVEPRFAALLTLPETPAEIDARKNNLLPDVDFVIGHDSSEQAQAIVALTIGFLSGPSCDQLAILLPGPGSVARLVASSLEKLCIPHNDAIAHPMRGTLDDEEWRAWLGLQKRPRLEPLLRFLEHSPAAVASFVPLSLRRIQDMLQRACGDILINTADVLREYCRSTNDRPGYQAIAAGLDAIRFLPENATFKTFVQIADEIFCALKWTERSAELRRLRRGWSEGFAEEDVSREHFLRWLREIFAESSLSRDTCGDHPYARVQLLRYDEAEAGSWSHVIFAGLNEGVWPPREEESPFLSDDTIASLNARNQKQSKRFGEGQQIAREGTTLCLGARERRAVALRQLLNVIESTTRAIGVAAEQYTRAPQEQAVNPSEFFARIYFSARGEALSQRDIAQIHEHTHEWLARADFLKPAGADKEEVKQTVMAYRTRRTTAPFGEYEFAFREGSPPPLKTFSATEIGNSLQRPALVWMKVFLGVEAEELSGGSWSLATGQWVHRWLASISALGENRFLPRPSAGEIVERVTTAADNFRGQILAILEACGRTREPDWWKSGWRNARHLAEQFARELAGTKDWALLATEWRLDAPHIIQLDGGGELRARGRVDLILSRADSSDEIWIFDYKTGEAKPLKSNARDLHKQLIAGDGVQICIYALALRRHFSEIYCSLLTRDEAPSPQLGLVDIVAQAAIWKEISRMQNTGVFGMLGEIRSDFAFTGTYPLATLAVDKDLLKEKWVRTHPAFARENTNERAP